MKSKLISTFQEEVSIKCSFIMNSNTPLLFVFEVYWFDFFFFNAIMKL